MTAILVILIMLTLYKLGEAHGEARERKRMERAEKLYEEKVVRIEDMRRNR